MRILLPISLPQAGRYDGWVPNKTIYVSDGDLPIYQRAQELADGNLSAAISNALRRYVDVQEGLKEGFDEVTVRVGVGAGRKVRFTAVLVGEWIDTREVPGQYRVYRGRKGKFVVHIDRGANFWMVDAEGKPAGWRGHLGIGDVRYGSSPRERTLEIVDTLEELRDKVPRELFEMVARSARQPTVEELDI
jgi:EXLDI family protein